MNRALLGLDKSPVFTPPKRVPGALNSIAIDIAAIGSAPFSPLVRKKEKRSLRDKYP